MNAIYLAVVDKYGQVVSTNRGNMFNGTLPPDLDIESRMRKAKRKKRKFIKDKIMADTSFFSAYGVIKIHGMILLSMGGRTIFMNFDAFDIINTQTPTNKEYLAPYM